MVCIFDPMKQEKRRRAPGAGRKRDASLPEGEPLAKIPPVWVTETMLAQLRALPDGKMSAFIRSAIQEKFAATDASTQSVPADRK